MSECVLGKFLTANGYARTPTSEGRRLAHRAAWEKAHGPIPAGKQIHHVCGNRACINVDHLEVLEPAEHNGRHRKCEHGDVNRYFTKSGGSRCRICRQEKFRDRYANDPVYREQQLADNRERLRRYSTDPEWRERRNAKRRQRRAALV